MKNKNYIYLIIIAVVTITLIWFSRNNKNQISESELLLNEKENMVNVKEEEESLNTLEGSLLNSDNEAKGNLMVITKDDKIYIKTSRDFSNLIGKRVIVSIKGTIDNFTLVNIQENLTKDEYIRID
jgi:hypothetical protein